MGRGGGVGEGSIAAPWPGLGFRGGCDRGWSRRSAARTRES
jgi:hypothetical protein